MAHLAPTSETAHSSHTAHTSPKERLTTLSVFLSFFLTLSLIALGQRALYDLNRVYNPNYRVCNQADYVLSVGESCPIEAYAFKTVLLHSYITLPLSLLSLFLMLYLRNRRVNTWKRALYHVTTAVVLMFSIQFLIEVGIYLFSYYPTIGWYYTLGLISLLLIVLVIYLERKAARAKAHGGGH